MIFPTLPPARPADASAKTCLVKPDKRTESALKLHVTFLGRGEGSAS